MRPFLILNSLAIEFFLNYFNVNKYYDNNYLSIRFTNDFTVTLYPLPAVLFTIIKALAPVVAVNIIASVELFKSVLVTSSIIIDEESNIALIVPNLALPSLPSKV